MQGELSLEKKENNLELKNEVWSDENEKILKEIGESCNIYKLMHLEASKKAGRKYSINMYVSAVLTAIAGLLSSINTRDCEGTDVFSIIIAVISFIVGTLILVIKRTNWEEKKNSHKNFSNDYAKIGSIAVLQLSSTRKNRANVMRVLNWVFSEYERLSHTIADISGDIQEKWEKIAKEKGLTIFTELSPIKIRIEEVNDAKENVEEENKEEIRNPMQSPRNFHVTAPDSEQTIRNLILASRRGSV